MPLPPAKAPLRLSQKSEIYVFTIYMIMKKTYFALLAIMLAAATASAQKRAFTIADLYRVKYAYGFSLSPTGDKLIAGLSSTNLKEHTSASDIFTVDLKAKTPQPAMQTSDGKSYSPVWNKDGRGAYFLALDSAYTTQLFHIDFSTQQREQLTAFELGISSPLLSPDGRLLAFVADVYPEAGANGKLNAELRKKKSAGPVHAHIADRLLYRHWTSYSDGRYQHIIVYDFQTKKYTDVTPGPYVSPVFSPSGADGGFCFSPDSREICYTSNHTDHPEANTNCDLWIVRADGSSEPRCITPSNRAWDGSPQYSPDGKYIAYRAQAVEKYESDLFRLALYDRATSQSRIISGDFSNWVEDFKWSRDSREIYFLAPVRGYEPLMRIDIRSGKISEVIPQRSIGSFEIGQDGYAYYSYSTTGKPSAIYRRKLSDSKGRSEQQLTRLNDTLESEVDIRPSEAMWIKGAAGDSVEVFIVKPHGFDPAKRYPLIVNVHGGPQMQWMDSFRGDWQVYPGAGYVVAYPNPHGSTGYGQAFTRAISGDWGGKPYEDVMLVTDSLSRLPYIDKDRMGAMGWSYGGYFMNWLQGQKHPFKCLASMMGLYDLPSMWGATEELWFPDFDLEGQPWNSELYKKFSPSQYVKNFKTPTLIITGEKDYRVSYTQSLQYFSVLQTLGIPSRLIVFQNDGHWPSTLNSMPVYYNAHLEWFHEYLGGAPAPWRTEDMINNRAEY